MNGLGNIIRDGASLVPARLIRPFGGPAAIFFHGGGSHIDDTRGQSNHHKASRFSDIAFCLKDNFYVLPLTMLPDVLSRPSHHKHAIFLMSEDGYANTLTNAADILEG